MKTNFTNFGCGIGYRLELRDFILSQEANVDFLEILAESFMVSSCGNTTQLEFLKELSDRFLILPHGVNLSIGSPTINQSFLNEIKQICEITNCPFYSDHLAITKMPGISLGHLSPIPYSEEMLIRIIKHVNYVQNYIERPLLLENVAYHFLLGDSPYAEVDFFNTLVAETKCGILLDLANLNANALNHGFNPYDYINKINRESIVQIHIAGGDYDQSGYLYDTHGNLVEKTTWELLADVLKSSNVAAILLEHDQNFPPYEHLIAQLEIAKKLFNNSKEANARLY